MTRKGKLFTLLYVLALTGFTGWLALDTFVIPHVYAAVEPPAFAASTPAAETVAASDAESADEAAAATGSSNGAVRPGAAASGRRRSKNNRDGEADSAQGTDSAAANAANAADPAAQTGDARVYDDGDTRVELSEYRLNDTTIYVADVQLSSADALGAVFARNAYGANVTETTSSMAERSGAILAVNGDYYGARERGYVIRNGTLYRSSGSAGQEDLAIYADGSFAIVREGEVSAEDLLAAGAVQVFSFGPALVENGAVSVSAGDEVGQAMRSNPRTAIAQVGELHYLFVVADGRTDASAGLSLLELAEFLRSLGAETAYNLDGGGSSAMVFAGELINNPTGSGRGSSERSVSDMIGVF